METNPWSFIVRFPSLSAGDWSESRIESSQTFPSRWRRSPWLRGSRRSHPANKRFRWTEKVSRPEKVWEARCRFSDWLRHRREVSHRIPDAAKMLVKFFIPASKWFNQSKVRTWLFRFRFAVNLFSLGSRLFLRTCNRSVVNSSFFFPVSYHHLPL